MKQVLLAIHGETPTPAVFQYAAGLCQRIRAELRILQFIGKSHSLLLPRTKNRTLGHLLENTFAGAAFAEQGMPRAADEILYGVSDPLKKLLADQDGKVPLKVTLSAGNPEKTLSAYVDTHRDIILTVFDPARERDQNILKRPVRLNQLQKKLDVPLVIVKDSPIRKGL